jgi:hypothetical protein
VHPHDLARLVLDLDEEEAALLLVAVPLQREIALLRVTRRRLLPWDA